MKQITIITTFNSADEAYSLNRIVIDQIKMFTMAGYKINVVVAEGFVPKGWYENPAVKILKIPNVPVSNELYIDKTFNEDVENLKKVFEPILKETDVAITHDIVYQPAAVKHNLALRQIVKEKEFKTTFLHWIHSSTKPSVLSGLRGGNNQYLELVGTPFPRSFYIAFNQYSIPRIAGWFGVEESQVKYVPHPHDFFEGKDPLTIKIVSKLNLLSKDIVCMYPCRLDRGKQPEVVIKIMHQVKEMGRTISCIIADFHSTAGDKVKYREEMKNLGATMGLSPTELVFLSEFEPQEGQQDRYELPHNVISELFEFTNTFILPSKSETYSLVAQEAAMKRNLVVLNQDFPPFRSIYGDSAIYKQFSSNIDAITGLDGETTTRYSDEKGYYKDVANIICYGQEHTRVLSLFNELRKKRNLKTVFIKHIEPLLMADPTSFNF